LDGKSMTRPCTVQFMELHHAAYEIRSSNAIEWRGGEATSKNFGLMCGGLGDEITLSVLLTSGRMETYNMIGHAS